MALPLGGTAVMEHAQRAGPPLALAAHLSGYLRKQKPADKGLQHPFEDDADDDRNPERGPYRVHDHEADRCHDRTNEKEH